MSDKNIILCILIDLQGHHIYYDIGIKCISLPEWNTTLMNDKVFIWKYLIFESGRVQINCSDMNTQLSYRYVSTPITSYNLFKIVK